MIQEEAIITSKGQITIPKLVREKLELEEGMTVVFLQENSDLVLVPKYKDPIQKMLQLRERMKLTQKELQQMMAESKKDWSKIE